MGALRSSLARGPAAAAVTAASAGTGNRPGGTTSPTSRSSLRPRPQVANVAHVPLTRITAVVRGWRLTLRERCSVHVRVLTIALTATAAGCYSYRAELALVPDRARVRVRFAAPRSLDVAVAGRDTVRLDGVTVVEGHVLGSRGDTLDLELRDARAGGASTADVVKRGATLAVVPGAGQIIERRGLDRGPSERQAASSTATAAASSPAVALSPRPGESPASSLGGSSC